MRCLNIRTNTSLTMKIINKDSRLYMVRMSNLGLTIILAEELEKLKKDSSKHFFETTFSILFYIIFKLL